ncbi:MAG TPA: galactose ABC transporter substrate-binding protein [Oribacterium sp.]|nr:galactose ABC transporter substrate-binding protein [Oribacterium sp.]
MRKYRGRGLSRVMGLLLLLLLSGCSAQQKLPARKTDGKLKIGVSAYDQYDAFVSELIQDLNDEVLAAKSSETQDIVLEVYNASQSQSRQNDEVQEMINADFDVICVNLVDRTAPTEVINAARNADVPIIFFNRELVEEDLLRWDKLYYVGANAFESGTMQGELAAEAIQEGRVDRNGDGTIQYTMLEGEAGHQDALARSESSVNRLLELGVKLDRLSYAIANWNRAQAKTQMDKFIKQYGTGIELVLANNDEMALGAIDAYEASDIPERDWPLIYGIDGTEAGLSAVRSGKMEATVYNDARGQAEAIFQLAQHLALDEPLSALPLTNDKYIRLPYQKVTSDNVWTFR